MNKEWWIYHVNVVASHDRLLLTEYLEYSSNEDGHSRR